VTTPPAPFRSSVMTVEPAWIDYNGHLNMAYYNVLFDRAHDEALLLIGLGPDYLASRACSTFSAEAHVRYLREIGEGDRMRVTMRLLAADTKRMHWWQELWKEDGAVLSATCEVMSLHMDMKIRKVAPLPAEIAQVLAAWVRASDTLPRPEGLGRVIGIPRSA
jgi:acyl-CoA thioester hydrolase